MYNLCCISNELKDEGYQFQTMTWKRFNQLRDEHGGGYRVSSALFPCLTHPEFEYSIEDVPQYDEIMELFRDIVFYNETWQVRLSTHPDQFNVLASENQASVDKTIAELNHHGWVMDKLGCQRNYTFTLIAPRVILPILLLGLCPT